jgi:hypothetical protein
MYLR